MGLARAAAITALVVAGLVVATATACQGRATLREPAPVDEPDRFPHGRHTDLACEACHPVDAVRAGVARIPGGDDHAPCDGGACHQRDFLAAPGPLCRICHAAVSVSGGASPLRSYPPAGGLRALAPRFSHAVHLDVVAMDRAVGFHVMCADCHTPGGEDRPRSPGHAECARCHAPEVGLFDAPDMTACAGCHQAETTEPRQRRRLITGDLHFDHANHRGDARGQRIPCGTCHPASPKATTSADHPAPTIAACVACHDDEARVGGGQQMRTCEMCHTTIDENIGRLAPRDHLPATERPADHTLAFRKDHGAEASTAPARCATCHTQLSGARHEACDECHQTMRPFDHTVTWRELDHGGEAAADADRCATCHVADACATCHQRPPRSHLAIALFRDVGHADAARINPRSCLTCHEPERSCTIAGCHAVAP